MKVSAVSEIKSSRKLNAKSPLKKDLTSFGITNTTINEPKIDVKKSDEAVKTTFLSNVSFGGHVEVIKPEKYGTSGCVFRVEGAPSGCLSCYGPGSALSYSKNYYPNSSIETVKEPKLNKYSRDYEEKDYSAYFADPAENVSSEVKRKNDFIVYDNVPKYPSLETVKNKYFSETEYKEDLHQYCRTMYEYYERLKTSDNNKITQLEELKARQQKEFDEAAKYKQKYDNMYVQKPWGGDIPEEKRTADYYYHEHEKALYDTSQKIDFYKKRIEDSKAQQRLATTLYQIFDESGSAFYDRDRLYHEKKDILYVSCADYNKSIYLGSVNDVPARITEKEQELSETKRDYNVTKSWLALKQREYNEVKDKYQSRAEANECAEEISKLEDKLKSIEKDMNMLKSMLDTLRAIPSKYKHLDEELKAVLSRLKSQYPKVENFYRHNIKSWQHV